MERRHKSFLQDAKVARDILSRRRQERLLQTQRRKRQRHANTSSMDHTHGTSQPVCTDYSETETESVTTAATTTEIDIPEAKPRGVLIVEDTTDEEDEWGHLGGLNNGNHSNLDNGTGGEHEHLLRKSEEEAQHLAESLFADKWSLDRAILLYGTLDEQEAHLSSSSSSSSSNHHHSHDNHSMRDYEAEREELHRRLDVSQRKAAQQLYSAYQQIQQAAHLLHLEPCVTRDAVHMLCRYAALKNGIHVKGVSTRMNNATTSSSSSSSATTAATAMVTDSMKQSQLEQHRDLNRARQAGALGSALLYFATRKLGHGRSLQQVCSSFSSNHNNNDNDNDNHGPTNNKDESSFVMIQPKHCSRAMKEVKTAFPDYVRSAVVATTTSPEPSTTIAATTMPNGTVPDLSSGSQRLKQEEGAAVVVGVDPEVARTASRNFVQHAVRSLALPEPAMQAIAMLFTQCTNDQRNLGWASGTKGSTLCGALTLLVCSAGATMQRLSQQAVQTKNHSTSSSHRPNKRIKIEHPTTTTTATHEKKETKPMHEMECKVKKEEGPFDVMSHVSFDQNGTATTAAAAATTVKRVREEEMKQMWNAWAKQSNKSWARDARDIEQSCGITSRTVLLDHYKTYIYPRRANLLELLQQQEQYSLQLDDHPKNDASIWCLLFRHIATAAPLLTLNGSSSH
eukprot:scaffold102417_cov51-Attheya_sp.AAC.1